VLLVGRTVIVKNSRWGKLLQMRREAALETPYFFFYGSLMERYKNFNRFLLRKVKTIQPAYCQGFLYQLPIGFPGLITLDGCQDLVVGELMTFSHPARIMRVLDLLENYYPDDSRRSVYLRRKLPVIAEGLDDSGNKVFIEHEAWVYTYPLEHLAPENKKQFFVSCGNWKLLSEQPPVKKSGFLRNLFKRLRERPQPQHVHIDPVLCLNEELYARWSASSACARFCKNPEQCRRNRRKRWDNFTLG